MPWQIFNSLQGFEEEGKCLDLSLGLRQPLLHFVLAPKRHWPAPFALPMFTAVQASFPLP